MSGTSRKRGCCASCDVAKFLVHAKARHHISGNVGDARQIICSASGEFAEHQLFRGASAQFWGRPRFRAPVPSRRGFSFQAGNDALDSGLKSASVTASAPRRVGISAAAFTRLARSAPTNRSTNSEPDMEKNGTPALPATVLARSVLPIPRGTDQQHTPLAIRAPSRPCPVFRRIYGTGKNKRQKGEGRQNQRQHLTQQGALDHPRVPDTLLRQPAGGIGFDAIGDDHRLAANVRGFQLTVSVVSDTTTSATRPSCSACPNALYGTVWTLCVVCHTFCSVSNSRCAISQ